MCVAYCMSVCAYFYTCVPDMHICIHVYIYIYKYNCYFYSTLQCRAYMCISLSV